ncbi:hypothetical protein PV342_10295, partial [Streptomyces sp. PA03-3a]|nr:hypothetical protein [Streptomyces sp. PA03-3a]
MSRKPRLAGAVHRRPGEAAYEVAGPGHLVAGEGAGERHDEGTAAGGRRRRDGPRAEARTAPPGAAGD